MKSLFSFIFLFLFANSAFAANLCDTSCNLIITFPDGGSITVVEPLVLTFGDGGLVETGSATVPYANGSILEMGAGEVLTFGANGSFNLGSGGNMDYTSIAVETTGDVTVEAIGGAEVIFILNISATAGTILLNSDTTIENNFSLTGDTLVGGTGSITNLGTVDVVSNTVTFTNSFINAGTFNIISGTAVFEADFNCEDGSSIEGASSSGGVIISGTMLLESGDIYLSSGLSLSNAATLSGEGALTISSAGSLTVADGAVISVAINDLSANVINVGDLTVIDFSDPIFQGWELTTIDGGTCTVTDGKCIDENGVKYEFTEEGLVPAEDGSSSGALSHNVLLLILISLFYMRKFLSPSVSTKLRKI